MRPKKAVSPESPAANRVCLLGALWTALASAGADLAGLWRNEEVREAVLVAVGPEEERRVSGGYMLLAREIQAPHVDVDLFPEGQIPRRLMSVILAEFVLVCRAGDTSS